MALDPSAVADALADVWRTTPTEAQVAFYSTNFPSLDAAVNAAVDAPESIPVHQAIAYYQVFYNRVPDEAGLDFWTNVIRSGIAPNDLEDYFNDASEFEDNYAGLSTLEIVTSLYRNVLGREPDLAGLDFWVGQVSDGHITIAQLGGFFARAPETTARFEPYIDAFLEHIVDGTQDFAGSLFDEIGGSEFNIITTQDGPRASMEMHTVEGATDIANAPIDLDGGDGIDVLRLIGNSDIRIDFTDPLEQVEQIDIDGDGINPGETDYNVRPYVNVQNFEIIDAWARGNALLDPSNDTEGYTGNLYFDGTGFGGDGTSLNGNIVLGGAGDDIIKGGIGNDFFAGGAGNNLLQGGRNADFFYQELSSLDTELTGQSVIKGGTTYDNDVQQNFDWLLLEASDDEEPIVVDLDADDDNGDPFSEGGLQGGGTVENGDITVGGAQAGVKLEDIENVNASGNFYGFLNIVTYGPEQIAETKLIFTTDNLAGPETGSGNEWANVRTVTVTVNGVQIVAGPSVIDPETLPEDSTAALGVIVDRLNAFYASLATDGNPANDAFANLVASVGSEDGRPALVISDDEARTFNEGGQGIGFVVDVEGNNTFEFDTTRDFEFNQEAASLFPDLYFGDFRDYTEGGAIPRIPGLSPGVTGQMELYGSAAVNYLIAGYDNDSVYGLGGNDLLMGGDLEFLLTHQNNVNLFDRSGHFAANLVESVNSDGEAVEVGNDGRDTLVGGDGSDDIVLELDGGEIHGGANPADYGNDFEAFLAGYLEDLLSGVDLSDLFEGDGGLLTGKQEDTLWLTTFTPGRTSDVTVSTDGSLDDRFILSALLGTTQDLSGEAEAADEAAALDAVTTDSVIYLDLGSQLTNEITDIYPYLTTFQGYGADRLGTADQSSYRDGFEAVTITGMDHINASGLGRIDYLAAGTNNPDLTFENQQNYRGTNSDLVLRGTDGLSIAIINQPLEFFGSPQIGMNALGAESDPWEPYFGLTFAPVLASGDSSGTKFDITNSSINDDGVFDADQVTSAEYTANFQKIDFDNELIAGRGDDVLEGRGGTDRLSGREGNDSFEVSLHFNNFQEVIEEQQQEGPLSDIAEALLQYLGGISDQALGRYAREGSEAFYDREVVDYAGKQGDGVKFINRDLDLVDRLGNLGSPDGLFLLNDADKDEAGSQSDRIGQDFRAAPEQNVAGQTLFTVTLTGVFADDNAWNKVVNISIQGGGTDPNIDIDVTGSVTVQDVVAKVNAAIAALAGNADPEVAALANLLHAEIVNDDEFVVLGQPGAYNFSGAIADTLEPDNPQDVGDAGAQVSFEEPVELIVGEDDELVFLSYQNRYDNEKTDSSTFSLGRTAYAEDLVVKLGADGTELVEGQQYRIDIAKLKDFDTISLTLNGQTFSVTVGVDEVEGTVISETTAQAVSRLISLINEAVAADDDSAIGNLIVQGGSLIPGQDIVSIFIREGSEDQDVYLDTPVVEITNQSGGVKPEWSISDLSNTHVSLTKYDGRAGQEGLNEGRDHTEQRGNDGDAAADYGDRFITFEGKATQGDTVGINRAILQTSEVLGANERSVLQGMDVAVFNAVNSNAPSIGEAQQEYLIDLGAHDAQLDISFDNSPTLPAGGVYLRAALGSDWPDDIGQPVVETSEGRFAALHGDDFLIGGDGNDDIDAGLGDDKVQASKDFGLGDNLKGGENVVIDASGRIQFNPDGTLLQVADANGDGNAENDGLTLVKFQDRAIFDERQFRAASAGGTSFIMTVGAASIAQAVDGTISSTYEVDEGRDGTIDDRGTLTEFETVRTLSTSADDTLNVIALSDDTQSGANVFGLGVSYDFNTGLLTADINDDGDFSDELTDGTATSFASFYQGFEELLLGSGNDVVVGSGGNETIAAGAGDDSVSGGGGNDVIGGGDGDDTLDGGDGNDFIIGGSGDDIIQGGFGNDTILGGSGDDSIDDAGGDDSIDAGAGNDTVNDSGSADIIHLGSGKDVLNLYSAGFNGGTGAANAGENQVIDGGSGEDTLNVIYGGFNCEGGLRGVVDQSDGSAANFEVVNIDPTNGGEVTFIVDRGAFMPTAEVNFVDVGSGDDAFVAEGNEGTNDALSLAGLDFNDVNGASFGGSGVEVYGNLIALDGLSGNDTLTSSPDNLGEILIGGLGNDVLDGGDLRGEDLEESVLGHMLFGGRGDDTIKGSEGSDVVVGGYGNDTTDLRELDGDEPSEGGDGVDWFVFDWDGDDNAPNAAASSNVQDGDGFDTVTGFTFQEDRLVFLTSSSNMDTYLANSGSKIVLEVAGTGADAAVNLTLLIDVDNNGVADAGIKFIDSGLTLGDLGTADEAFFQSLGLGDVSVTFKTDTGTAGTLDAQNDVVEIGNLPASAAAFDAFLGGAPVVYGLDFQDDINPFADRVYDPLGEGFITH
jgi:Ca2+-binding RTX toxin-like protein